VKIFSLIFGYSILVVSFAIFFLTYSFYKKLNFYLMDNNINRINGHWLLIVQFGVRNFYYGIFHYFIRYLSYQNGMATLVISELVFLFIISIAINQKIYKSHIKIWIFIIQNFLKIVLFLTLILDYK